MIRQLLRLASAVMLLIVAVWAVAGSIKRDPPVPETSSYLALPGKFARFAS